MKIAVIGGGGVRSMFLAKSLAQGSEELGFDEIVFMDNDEKKLNIYGRMSAQLVKTLHPGLDFKLTTDPVEAVKDADYIITTIRVGGDDMRIRDEKAALAKHLLGQETTGAAGFSFAMRSVPALAEYCELAKKYASPDVKIFNFTNPAGVVSQTLRDMGYDFTYGICDAPSSLLHSFAKLYGVEQDAVTGNCYGLNHLSFFESVKLNGREIMPELLRDDRIYTDTDMRFFQKDLVEHMGCILNEYLYYFFYREQAIEHILNAHVTRGEVIRDVNHHMMEELSHMDIENDFENCLKVFDKWYGKRDQRRCAPRPAGHRYRRGHLHSAGRHDHAPPDRESGRAAAGAHPPRENVRAAGFRGAAHQEHCQSGGLPDGASAGQLLFSGG